MAEKLTLYQDPVERFNAIDGSEFSTFMGMRTVRVSEDEVVVEMDLEGKLNSVGTGHGGAIFSLADQAFAIACNMGEYTQVARSAVIRVYQTSKGEASGDSSQAQRGRARVGPSSERHVGGVIGKPFSKGWGTRSRARGTVRGSLGISILAPRP